MSTRSGVGLLMPDGTIKAIYVHWDGYVSGGVGETLASHYTERAKIEKLIALGDLSSLGAEVDPDPAFPHNWKHPQKNVTVAYHRDRNDPLEPAIDVKDKESFPEVVASCYGADYAYLFEDGCWLVCDLSRSKKPWQWKVLTDVLGVTGWKLNGTPVQVYPEKDGCAAIMNILRGKGKAKK